MNKIPGCFRYWVILFMVLKTMSAFTQTKPSKSDSPFVHKIKIDVLASYNTVFNSRQQLRIGFGYEKVLTQHAGVSIHLDIGLYDNYSFTKYYDFFNQNQGMFSVQQHVMTSGFHLMPGYSYLLLRPLKKLSLYGAAVLDFSFYKKKNSIYNSQTGDRSFQKIYQTRTGLGPALDLKYRLSRRLFAEIKTNLFLGVLTTRSDKNMQSIKSQNAHWTNTNNNFWWVTQTMIGYAF